MKRTLLLVLALGALCQSAFALGETKGLGNIFGDAKSTGLVDVVASKGANPTCARDSLIAIKAAITDSFNKAVAAQDNYQTNVDVLQPGCYKVGSAAATSESATIDLYPATTLMSFGKAKLDGTSAPSGTTFFRIDAGAWPSSDPNTAWGQGAAAARFALQNVDLYGRVGDANSVGVSIGNATDTSITHRNTKAGIKGMYIQDVGIGLLFQPYDTYLNRIEDVSIRNPYTACISFVDAGDGTTTNSGENMVFDRGVCSGGQVDNTTIGFLYNTSARNVTLNGWSFDFNDGSAFHIPEMAGFGGYGTVTHNDEHVENSLMIATSSETSAFFMHVIYNNLYHVPGKNTLAGANNQFNRPYINMPGVNLTINGLHVGLVSGTYSDISGLYFVTSPTINSGIRDVDFQGYRVLMHESLNPYDGWNFRNSATGQFKFDSVADLYVKNQGTGLDISLITSATAPELGLSQKRVQINPNGNNFIDLVTPLYIVRPGSRIYGGPAVYGGTTNAALNYTQQYIFMKPAFKPPVSVTSVTKSTNNLNFVVADITNFISSSLACPLNVQSVEYLNKCWPVNAISGNTVTLRVSSTYPTPVAVTGTTIALDPEDVAIVSSSNVATIDVSATYGNAADGAYDAGRRTHYSTWEMNRTVTRTNDLRVPTGATLMRVLLGFVASATTPFEVVGIPLNQIQ